MKEQSLTEYLAGQPIVLVALGALLLAAVGWMIEHSRPGLAQRMRLTGYVGMLAAGALIVVDAARKAEHSDARIEFVPQTEARVSGSETVIPIGPDGHFHVRLMVNGKPVAAMIDTGASFTTFEEATARGLDLAPSTSRLPGEMDTANGVITARFATARQLQLGNVVVANAEVAITPDTASPQAVVGMNLLSRLARWRVEDGELRLTPPD